MSMTGFYFDQDTSKFQINITSVKIDDHEREKSISIFQINLLKTIDRSTSLVEYVENPLHTIVLHWITITTQ